MSDYVSNDLAGAAYLSRDDARDDRPTARDTEGLTDKRRYCRHCEEEIEFYPSVGWVCVLSGDEGGTYDFCPSASTQKHRP